MSQNWLLNQNKYNFNFRTFKYLLMIIWNKYWKHPSILFPILKNYSNSSETFSAINFTNITPYMMTIITDGFYGFSALFTFVFIFWKFDTIKLTIFTYIINFWTTTTWFCCIHHVNLIIFSLHLLHLYDIFILQILHFYDIFVLQILVVSVEIVMTSNIDPWSCYNKKHVDWVDMDFFWWPYVTPQENNSL